MEYNADDAVSRFRNATAQLFAGLPEPAGFQNAGEDQSVLAAEFLSHLDLDHPKINHVLRQAYRSLDHNPEFRTEIHARVRFIAWMTLKGFNQLAPAIRLLEHDLSAQRLLGFTQGVPCYDTLREFMHERLTGRLYEELLEALLTEQHRLLPSLGLVQVEDATPLEARRREEEAPYNPHYGVRMQKLELRWDVVHEALLAQQYYHGLLHEGQWVLILTKRLEDVGLHGNLLTVDGGYTSFHHIAHQWRCGQPMAYKLQEGWVIDREESLRRVLKRYQNHRMNPAFQSDAPLMAKLRFLVDYGSEQDIDAVGRYLRDDYLTTKNVQQDAQVKSHRSQNEGLNAEYKRLPLAPAKRGTRELYRRAQACSLTLHLVQITRLQNGVSTHLCRTANIL